MALPFLPFEPSSRRSFVFQNLLHELLLGHGCAEKLKGPVHRRLVRLRARVRRAVGDGDDVESALVRRAHGGLDAAAGQEPAQHDGASLAGLGPSSEFMD